jgi:TonB family protein
MSARELLLLVIVGFGPLYAQANRAAESLISEVASVARTGASWSAEGYIVTSGPDGTQTSPEQFRIEYHVSAPFRARFEITSGTNPLVRICDGVFQWTSYPSTKSYVRVFLPQIGPCAYPINAWPLLSITLRSPTAAGDDRVTIDGHPRECKVVRGTFSASANDPSRRTLEMCVDPTTKMILRYRMEELSPQPHTQIFTFSSIQRDVALDAERFRFQAPAGSAEVADINWLDPIAQPKEGVFRVSNDVTAPILISMVAPESAGVAQKSLGGVVVLYAEVSVDGIPENIRVIRPIGQGLDEKAVEAVKKWRFEPAVRDGKPVPVVTALAVNVR